jgi:preprotein translocase subunit SecB
MDNNLYDFMFNDFRLLSVHFDLKTDKEYKLRKDVEVKTNLSLNHEYFQEQKTLKLVMRVDVHGEKLPFSLSIQAGGSFIFPNCPEKTSPDDLDKIARIHCAAIIFPYLREAVADIVRRSGLPQLNLPPVNFVEYYKKNTKEATTHKIFDA